MVDTEEYSGFAQVERRLHPGLTDDLYIVRNMFQSHRYLGGIDMLVALLHLHVSDIPWTHLPF